MLASIIEEIGTTRVARACGVTVPCVSIWKAKGSLPTQPAKKVAGYEKAIAACAGVTVKELRERLKSEDEAA